MIRKLKEEDRQRTLEFLSDEPAVNLFAIGDIENFGFSEDFLELWGSFNKDTKILEGVLLKFHENYVPYYKDSKFDISEFKKIIEADKNDKIISGKEDIVDNFRGILRKPIEKSNHFCELRKDNKLKKIKDEVKLAAEKDAVRIYDLLEGIEEFQETDTNSVERIKKVINDKLGRIYYLENEKGELVSVSQTTAENSKSAMIVGVATHEGYRKKGLMSQCLSKLCYDLLSEGKTLCLFYSNPKAGSVYHKIGFKTIGKWKMLIEGKE